MKARAAGSGNHRRPSRWLSLLVSLSLLVPPSQICALMEATPGHSHGASSHSHEAGHSHEAAGAHHGEHVHVHAQAAHYGSSRLAFAPIEPPETCCGQSEAIPVVAASTPGFAAPHRGFAPIVYAPAILPQAQEIFALANCHGRDGPSDKPLRSQFVPLSLLGRAPPVSV